MSSPAAPISNTSVGLVSTFRRVPLAQLAHWIDYHQRLGVSRFFLYVDDAAERNHLERELVPGTYCLNTLLPSALKHSAVLSAPVSPYTHRYFIGVPGPRCLADWRAGCYVSQCPCAADGECERRHRRVLTGALQRSV